MEPVATPRRGRHAIGAEAGWQRQVPLALCGARRPDPQGIAIRKLIEETHISFKSGNKLRLYIIRQSDFSCLCRIQFLSGIAEPFGEKVIDIIS